MKDTYLFIFLLYASLHSRGQEIDFKLGNMVFNGVGFSTSKDRILKTFGPGTRVDTDYECGFFSNDQPTGPYYQLVYPGFNYIGSDKENFYLEYVAFDPQGQIQIMYNDRAMSGHTSKEEFIKILGDNVRILFEQSGDKNSILIYSKGSYDGARFAFKDNRLLSFQYWTPC